MQQDPMSRFEINLQPNGIRCSYVVDGQDRSEEVIGCQINARMGELTTVMLELAGSGKVTGTGHIENLNAGDAAVQVGMLDPSEVEKRALASMEWGDSGSMTQALLATIVEMLDETESKGRTAHS
jgi:hypothetical protein